jgi:hypothetical protein
MKYSIIALVWPLAWDGKILMLMFKCQIYETIKQYFFLHPPPPQKKKKKIPTCVEGVLQKLSSNVVWIEDTDGRIILQ